MRQDGRDRRRGRRDMNREDIAKVLAKPISRELLGSSIPARPAKAVEDLVRAQQVCASTTERSLRRTGVNASA